MAKAEGEETFGNTLPPARGALYLPNDPWGVNGRPRAGRSLGTVQLAGMGDAMVETILKNIQKQGAEGARPATKVEVPTDAAAAKPGPGLPTAPAPEQVKPLVEQTLEQARIRNAETSVGIPHEAKWDSTLGTNLERVNTSDDVKELISTISAARKEQLDLAGRGTQTFGEIERDANLLNLSISGVTQLKALRADEMLEARRAQITLAEELQAISRKAGGPAGTEADMVRMRQTMQAFVAVQQHVKGLQTETARTLAAMRIPAGSTASKMKAVTQMLDQWGGYGANKRLAQMIADAGSVNEVAALTNKTYQATTWDMMMEGRKAGGLLTSPTTHLLNFLGNVATTVTGIPAHALASLFSATRRGFSGAVKGIDPADAIFAREIVAGFHGLAGGLLDGMGAAGHALLKGERKLSTGWNVTDGAPAAAITGENAKRTWWGKLAAKADPTGWVFGESGMAWRAFDFLGFVTRLSTRAIMANDEFFSAVNFWSEMHRRAMRETLASGLSGQAADVRYREIISDPETHAPDARLEAMDYVGEQTFNRPLEGPLARILGSFRRPDAPVAWKVVGAVLDLLMPFKTAPINIVRYTAQHLPGFNMLVTKSREDILGKNGKAAQDLALAKLTLGTASISTFMWMAANGRITGGGPLDPREKMRMKEMSGAEPYSFIFDDGSTMSLYRLGPIGNWMGLAADTVEVWNFMTAKERQQMAALGSAWMGDWLTTGMTGLASFGIGTGRNVVDQSPFVGVRDFLNLLGDLQAGEGVSGARSWLAKMGASFQPYGAAQRWLNFYFDDGLLRNPAADQLDGYGRQQAMLAMAWKEMINRVKMNTPELSKQVPPRLGFWGQGIFRAPYLMENVVPFVSSKVKWRADRLEAIGVSANPNTWGDLVYPTTMSYDQLEKFTNEVGIDGELVRLGMPVGDHPRDIHGIPLNAKQEAAYRTFINQTPASEPIMVGKNVFDLRGMTMREAMDQLVREPFYLAAPDFEAADDDKGEMLQRVANHYRHGDGVKNEFGLAGADAMLFEADPMFALAIQRQASAVEMMGEDAALQSILGGN